MGLFDWFRSTISNFVKFVKDLMHDIADAIAAAAEAAAQEIEELLKKNCK